MNTIRVRGKNGDVDVTEVGMVGDEERRGEQCQGRFSNRAGKIQTGPRGKKGQHTGKGGGNVLIIFYGRDRDRKYQQG